MSDEPQETPKLVDARRLYLTLGQMGFWLVVLTGGAAYFQSGFGGIDRKFDGIDHKFELLQFQLNVINEKVADPVTRDDLRKYLALYKALNPAANVPPFD